MKKIIVATALLTAANLASAYTLSTERSYLQLSPTVSISFTGNTKYPSGAIGFFYKDNDRAFVGKMDCKFNAYRVWGITNDVFIPATNPLMTKALCN